MRLSLLLLIESQVRVGSLDPFTSVYGTFIPGILAAGRISRTITHSHRHLSERMTGRTLTQLFIEHPLNEALHCLSMYQELCQALRIPW